MLDPKVVRTNPTIVADAMRRRHKPFDIEALTALEERRRGALTKVEGLKAELNATSKLIAELKRRKEDAGDTIAAMRRVGDEIKGLNEEARVAEDEFL